MRTSWKLAAAIFPLLLAGCSVKPGFNSGATTQSSSVPGAAIQGRVHGGQQPIVGARIYLYGANTGGYGSSYSSISLLASGAGKDSNGNYYVTTGTGGSFSIAANGFTCPSNNPQVYLYSIGGNPGLAEGTNNTAAGLMAALGPCSGIDSVGYVVVNEVSTVATAYAIAGFSADATHVSSSNSSLATLGIGNAFGAVANLETLGTGTALATTPAWTVNGVTPPSGNGAPPQQEINTLANILAACINTTGAVTGGASPTPCYTLFTNALSGGLTGTTPSDTATAAIYIAHNPGISNNITNLFSLQTATSPFQPDLSVAPSDFTVAITYSGGGLGGTSFYAPEGVAVDGYGNVWVPNYSSNVVSEFNYRGASLAGENGFNSAGLNEPTSVAIDIYGNAWIANYQGNSISEISSTGVNLSGGKPGYYVNNGLNAPYGITIDSAGNTWVANNGGNDLSEFSNGGAPLSGSNGFSGAALTAPTGIAADTSGNVWTVDYGAADPYLVGTMTVNTAIQINAGFSGGGLGAPYAVAIDNSGNFWVTNETGGSSGNGSISKFSSGGTAATNSPYSDGGVWGPYGIAIDGAGNVWVANFGGWSISELNSSGTAISPSSTGYAPQLISPYSLAIDPSGNVWVATDNGSASLTELVGAATPVVTPLAAGAKYGQLGVTP